MGKIEFTAKSNILPHDVTIVQSEEGFVAHPWGYPEIMVQGKSVEEVMDKIKRTWPQWIEHLSKKKFETYKIFNWDEYRNRIGY